MSKHRLRNNSKLDLLKGMQMEGPLRYRQLGNYANRRNIRIRHLRNRFNPLQEYHNEDFRSRFRLRKDSVIDRKKFGEGSSTSNKERTAANTNAASAYCFEILCHRNFNFQRVIGDIFGVSAFAAFAFSAKQRAQFLSFPENLADTKRKFYDVVHFPGVIGAIDCTQIRIICPNKENAMAFVNRGQF